jgi:hypothetical protein
LSGKRDSNPRPSAWEADALPLSYSRKFLSLTKIVNRFISANILFDAFRLLILMITFSGIPYKEFSDRLIWKGKTKYIL